MTKVYESWSGCVVVLSKQGFHVLEPVNGTEIAFSHAKIVAMQAADAFDASAVEAFDVVAPGPDVRADQ